MGRRLKVNAFKDNNVKHLGNKNVSFTSAPTLYKVKNQNILKKAAPIIAFIGASVASLAYLVGSVGLFYDLYADKKAAKNSKKSTEHTDKPASTSPTPPDSNLINLKLSFKNNLDKQENEGAKTVVANTKFAKACMNFAKLGIMTSATSGMACGIAEGLPIMTLGEATVFSSGKQIETPIGTGLFGIGIGSIFSALALDNTPELKLNSFKMLAKDNITEKGKLILKNLWSTVKEVLNSVKIIARNFYKPEFLKENFLHLTPKTIVFQESINQKGVVTLNKMLRHNRNYLMHAASFTLGLGGGSLVLTSILKTKKAQKASLQLEEGGFLFDNFGMTKYGLDKFTAGSIKAGAPFAAGGLINAVSQFMGLDNKDGRAVQWLGIFLVFLGFSVDRGKFLKGELAKSKVRSELTDVVREWKLDLSKLIKNDPAKLKKVLKEIKQGAATTSSQEFNTLSQAFTDIIGNTFHKDKKVITALKGKINPKIVDEIVLQPINDVAEMQNILTICSKKIFGEVPEVATP